MRIRELLLVEIQPNPALPVARDSDDDSERDEMRRIAADKQIKRRPNVRKMLFTNMPGNDSTYPAF